MGAEQHRGRRRGQRDGGSTGGERTRPAAAGRHGRGTGGVPGCVAGLGASSRSWTAATSRCTAPRLSAAVLAVRGTGDGRCIVGTVPRGAGASATGCSSRRAPAASRRRAGSFSSSPSSAGASGPDSTKGAWSRVSTAVTVSSGPSASYGGCPSAAVNRVAPSDHRSEGGPACSPAARSGGMYAGEPSSRPVLVSEESPSVVAMPKSVSTGRSGRPSAAGASSTLDGLTSRCRIPRACAASRALSSARPTRATRSTGSGPSSATTCARVGASTSSITSQGRPPSSTTSYSVTAWGWDSRAAERASRRVRSRRTWAAAGLVPGGKVTSLTAVCRPSSVSSARQTVPMPPEPRVCSRR